MSGRKIGKQFENRKLNINVLYYFNTIVSIILHKYAKSFYIFAVINHDIKQL